MHLKITSRIALIAFLLGFLTIIVLLTPTAQEPSNEQYLRDLSQLVEKTIQMGDIVFLASSAEELRQKLAERQVKIIPANPNDYDTVHTSLQQWLDQTCHSPDQNANKRMYFLRTDRSPFTTSDLGTIARLLIFFFNFQNLVPSGSLLQLSQRVSMVTRYCQAKAVAGQKPVIMVVTAEEFQSTLLLGSVSMGNTIWLASNETRKAWDSGWTGKEWTVINWSFTNHDSRAFTAGIRKIIEQNGIILVDKQATLGAVAQKFLRSCAPNEITVTNDAFTQMCPNVSALAQ